MAKNNVGVIFQFFFINSESNEKKCLTETEVLNAERDSPFLLLQLQEGNPHLHLSNSDEKSAPVDLTIDDAFCADADFHTIEVHIKSGNVSMEVDNCPSCGKENQFSRRSAILPGQHLFVGGFPSLIRADESNLTTRQFQTRNTLFQSVNSIGLIGCIGDLRLNSQLIHLPSFITRESHVQFSCPRKQKESICNSEPSLCANDGECVSTWGPESGSCKCDDYHSGPLCEQGIESISFTRGTFVVFALNEQTKWQLQLDSFKANSSGRKRRSVSDAESIELRFQADSLSDNWQTFLYYDTTKGRSFSLRISTNRIRIDVDVIPPVIVSAGKLDDGNFHTITLTGNALFLDGTEIESNQILGSRQPVKSESLKNLVIGSESNGFQGCLLWVKVDHAALPLGKTSKENSNFEITQQSSTQGNSIPVCQRADFCSNVICPLDDDTQLTCLSLVDRYKCRDMTACADEPCQYGTLCIPDDEVPSRSYTCDCGLHFGGKNCEIALGCEQNAGECEQKELECVGLSEHPFYSCEDLPSGVTEEPGTTFEIILGVSAAVFGLLLLGVFVCVLCYCWRRQKCFWKKNGEGNKLSKDFKMSSNTSLKHEPSGGNFFINNPPDVVAQTFTTVAPGVEVEEDVDGYDFDDGGKFGIKFPLKNKNMPAPPHHSPMVLDSTFSYSETQLCHERVITPLNNGRLSSGSLSQNGNFQQNPAFLGAFSSSPQFKTKSPLSLTEHLRQNSSSPVKGALFSSSQLQVGETYEAGELQVVHNNSDSQSYQNDVKLSSRDSESSFYSSFPDQRFQQPPTGSNYLGFPCGGNFDGLPGLRHQENTINEEEISASRSDDTDTFTNDVDRNFTGSEFDLDTKIEKSTLPTLLENLPEKVSVATSEYASTFSHNRTNRSSNDQACTTISESSFNSRSSASPDPRTRPASLLNVPFENAVDSVLNDAENNFLSYGAMFHGRYKMNFSELSPVFQDVANLPDVPEFQEDDEDTLHESKIFLKV